MQGPAERRADCRRCFLRLRYLWRSRRDHRVIAQTLYAGINQSAVAPCDARRGMNRPALSIVPAANDQRPLYLTRLKSMSTSASIAISSGSTLTKLTRLFRANRIGRSQLPQKAREMLAIAEVERLSKQAEGPDLDSAAPKESWKQIAAFLGMPVEFDPPEEQRRPWATWLLSAPSFASVSLRFQICARLFNVSD